MNFSDHNECLKIQRTLLEAGESVNEMDFDGRTALMKAVLRGNLKSMTFLLENGATINLRDGWHNTALLNSIDPGREHFLELLVREGADVNLVGGGGETPLIKAARDLNASLVKLLLEAGADVNMVNRSKDTALNVSVIYCRSNERNVTEKVRLLLKAGCHINKKCRYVVNALYWNIRYGNRQWKTLNMLLFAAGENVNHKAIRDKLPDYLKETENELCLKHLCRGKIRQVLIDKDPHENLFVRIPCLCLPSLVNEYLLYGMNLDDQHVTSSNIL